MVYGIWTFVAALVAFIISAVAGAFLIPMLRKLHFGQTILEDGPKWHKKKTGYSDYGRLYVYYSYYSRYINKHNCIYVHR